MQVRKQIIRAKIINKCMIIWTIIFFLVSFFTRGELTLLEKNILFIVNFIISTTLIIFAIFSFIKLKKQYISGGGLLLAAGILMFLFNILGFSIGLFIYILCGFSMSELNKQL